MPLAVLAVIAPSSWRARSARTPAVTLHPASQNIHSNRQGCINWASLCCRLQDGSKSRFLDLRAAPLSLRSDRRGLIRPALLAAVRGWGDTVVPAPGTRSFGTAAAPPSSRATGEEPQRQKAGAVHKCDSEERMPGAGLLTNRTVGSCILKGCGLEVAANSF